MGWDETTGLPCSTIWPEPLIIELVALHLDRYPIGDHQRTVLARRHASALHAILHDGAGWCVLRGELQQIYGALGLTSRDLASIDRVVFTELARLIAERHRLSSRRRQKAGLALRAALYRLVSAIPAAPDGYGALAA